MAATAVLDASIIDEVRDALGDAAYRGFAATLLAEITDLTPRLDALLRAGAHEELAQTAHRSAGSAVSVGAVAIHALLKEIEDQARLPDAPARLPALLNSLPARLSDTRAAIAALVGPV